MVRVDVFIEFQGLKPVYCLLCVFYFGGSPANHFERVNLVSLIKTSLSKEEGIIELLYLKSVLIILHLILNASFVI